MYLKKNKKYVDFAQIKVHIVFWKEVSRAWAKLVREKGLTRGNTSIHNGG